MLFCVLCTYFSSLIKITLLVFLIVYDHCSKQRREIKKKKKSQSWTLFHLCRGKPSSPFCVSLLVTEQDPTGHLLRADPTPHHVLCLHLVCRENISLLDPPRVPKSKFNQRSEKMKKGKQSSETK